MPEHMELQDEEIARRKGILNYGAEDDELLLGCREVIEAELQNIVDDFYRVQTQNPEVTALLGDEETFRRLHETQRRYVLDLFEGRTDGAYVKNRLRIGAVHKRIGVAPKLYLAAVKTLRDILFKTLKGHLPAEAADAPLEALDKLLYFDTTLVFDAYTLSLVEEVRAEKARVESYAASLEEQVAERTRELAEKVQELEKALSMVKKLEGVIPICGICKKIRDDKESWQQLEQYISEHSEAHFSHGLCPDCYEKEMAQVMALRERKLLK